MLRSMFSVTFKKNNYWYSHRFPHWRSSKLFSETSSQWRRRDTSWPQNGTEQKRTLRPAKHVTAACFVVTVSIQDSPRSVPELYRLQNWPARPFQFIRRASNCHFITTSSSLGLWRTRASPVVGQEAGWRSSCVRSCAGVCVSESSVPRALWPRSEQYWVVTKNSTKTG